jgi:hypothetical protein
MPLAFASGLKIAGISDDNPLPRRDD